MPYLVALVRVFGRIERNQTTGSIRLTNHLIYRFVPAGSFVRSAYLHLPAGCSRDLYPERSYRYWHVFTSQKYRITYTYQPYNNDCIAPPAYRSKDTPCPTEGRRVRKYYSKTLSCAIVAPSMPLWVLPSAMVSSSRSRQTYTSADNRPKHHAPYRLIINIHKRKLYPNLACQRSSPISRRHLVTTLPPTTTLI